MQPRGKIAATTGVLNIILRIMLIVGILAAVLIIYQTCSGSPLIQRIDKMPPEKELAPLEVPTTTRTYYAERAVENADGSVTMSVRWYSRDGDSDKWIEHTETFTLPAVVRPRVQRR